MQIKIEDVVFNNFTDLRMTIRYDSLVSDFTFSVLFDPNNKTHKRIFKPLGYQRIVISDGSATLLTGTVLNIEFEDSPTPTLVTISGYSRTGVLEDCQIPLEEPLQWFTSNLKEITEKLITPFDLKLVIDPLIEKYVNVDYNVMEAKETQTIKDFLAKIASQKHAILTHDEFGNVRYTKAKVGSETTTDETLTTVTVTPVTAEVSGAPEYNAQRIVTVDYKPVFTFSGNSPDTKMKLICNGQNMHSTITAMKQGDPTGSQEVIDATIVNPYVTTVYRPNVSIQSASTGADAPITARNILSDELKNISLSIETNSWYLGKNIARVNTLVNVASDRLFLYKKTLFFIREVTYMGSHEKQILTLNCVIPDVFTDSQPVNIFG
jgi:prophage tail gpP-like protein